MDPDASLTVEDTAGQTPETGRVLVVDDHPSFRLLLSEGLRRAGYKVTTAATGAEALAHCVESLPDAVLLDVLMPGMDGYEVCRRIRDVANTPVIMVSALRNEDEIIRGLDAGADDYVTKPFSVSELVARLRALRRRSQRAEEGQQRLVLGGGGLQIGIGSREVILNGEAIHLGPTEFRLLAYLALNAGRAVPRAELVAQTWGPDGAHLEKYLKIYVRRLRQKIEPDGAGPFYIQTVPGGYRLDPNAGQE
jgi:two-component system, OmpR family, KDP operon response regulator KdpE